MDSSAGGFPNETATPTCPDFDSARRAAATRGDDSLLADSALQGPPQRLGEGRPSREGQG